jgi:hypothetical protein
LNNGADIEAYYHDGLPLLFLAGKHPKAICMLIHRGTSIDARNFKSWNQGALHYYASLGQIDALRILWTCGCNIHLTDDNNNTVLHYAVKNGRYGVAIMLLEQGVDINSANNEGENALYMAVECRFHDLAKLLIDYGIDIEAKTFISEYTALHLAIEKGNLAMVSLLVERHANVNAKDARGYIPLHYAATYNMEEECILMIEHGADVNSKDRGHFTPLHAAALTANPNLVNVMINRGGSVHSIAYGYGTPLEYAFGLCMAHKSYYFERNFVAVVRTLINAGASNVVRARVYEVAEEIKERFPPLRNMLQVISGSSLDKELNIQDESSVMDLDFRETRQSNVPLQVVGHYYGKECKSKCLSGEQ